LYRDLHHSAAGKSDRLLECGIDLVSQALYRPLRMEACSKVRRALKQKYPRYRGYLDAGSQ